VAWLLHSSLFRGRMGGRLVWMYLRRFGGGVEVVEVKVLGTEMFSDSVRGLPMVWGWGYFFHH